MCCSWRWVVVAPNPKDFGLFLAQVVRTIRPKMETSSHWREVEVSQVQHPLCLPDEGKYSLSSMPPYFLQVLYYHTDGLIYSALLILYNINICNISCNSVKSWLNYIEQHLSLVSAEGLIHVSLLQLYVLRWRWRLGSWVLWRDNCDKKWTEKSQAEEDSKKLNTSGLEIINPTKWR